MYFSRALLAGIAMATYASAQSARVAFTSVPAVVTGGESYNITWGGGDGSAVTITLRKGDPDDLDTVGVLADSVEGTSYLWTVSRTLEAADDYALQITQGQDEINYSGQFSLARANTTSSSSAGSSTTSSFTGSTTTIALSSNSTMTGNSTVSTSSIPRTITTTPATSAHTPSTSNTAAADSTAAPSSNGAVQMTSSAALVMAVIAAVAYLH